MSAEPLLEMHEGRLQLRDPDQPLIKPIFVDFMAHDFQRRAREPKAAQLLAKALGLGTRKSLTPPLVVDATAGLGTDTALMAIWGCEVIALERSSLVFQLLEDGRQRALSEGLDAMSRVTALHQSAEEYGEQILSQDNGRKPHIVFLDPMYPDLKKTALPRKEMQILRNVLKPSETVEVQSLFELVLKIATERVVIKRPPHAEELRASGRGASHSLEGKAVRYDIYVTKK